MLFESVFLNFLFEVLLPPSVVAFFLCIFVLAMHKKTFAAAMTFKQMAIKKHDNLSQTSAFSDLSAAVIVCGDIARSPRMQYHAVSLCETAAFKKVHIVGSDMGNRCCEKLENFRRSGQASFCLVKEDESTKANSSATTQQKPKSWISRVVNRVLGLFGVYYNAISKICEDPNLSVILVQTPPVIPTLPIVFLVVMIENVKRAWNANFKSTAEVSEDSSRKGSPPIRVIFDVHNLGWTILRAEKRPKLFVWIYKLLETIFCRTGIFSDARITVANALGEHLAGGNSAQMKKKNVVVMPDAAPDFFRPSSREELVSQVLDPSLVESKVQFGPFGNNVPSWFYETKSSLNIRKKSSSMNNNNNNTLLVAGSTSWTADDDYTVVVDAVKKVHDELVKINKTLPQDQQKKLWLFISGKGPSRHLFEEAIQKVIPENTKDNNDKNETSPVQVSTGYFQSFSDYALFLGAADLGLCLHHSSSGLDLPMKGVDMLGAGLPVCALRYLPALPELVTEKTGWLFDNSEDLAKIWIDLLLSSVESDKKDSLSSSSARRKLEEAKNQIQKDRKFWVSSWEDNVVPLIYRLMSEV